MESQHDGHSAKPKTSSKYELSIMTFRRMLSSAVQDLFGATMGGGINIDILGYWTDAKQDPYNRLATSITPPSSIQSSNIPSETATGSSSSSQTTTAVASAQRKTATVKWTHMPTTAASAVLRCHASDLNQLWSSLTLFNTLVDESEARFEVRYVSGTLLGLQANSRQMQWV